MLAKIFSCQGNVTNCSPLSSTGQKVQYFAVQQYTRSMKFHFGVINFLIGHWCFFPYFSLLQKKLSTLNWQQTFVENEGVSSMHETLN